MPSTPILSPSQAAEWDAQADAAGIAVAALMECAGRAVAAVTAARFPQAVGKGILVAAGPGNNGGDGWVAARAFHRAGIPVWVTPLPGSGSPLQHSMSARAQSEGVRVVEPTGPWPGVGLVIDAILGTGAKGAPRAPAGDVLARCRELRVPLVAVDGPSGVDLATGAVYGEARADLSITFGGLRRGHLLAREEVGTVVVVDIGLPPANPAWPLALDDAVAGSWLPALRAKDHKGSRGRVVVIGGAEGMTGAVRMSARAAFAAGAGLVHAVAPPATVAALAAAEPDLQTLPHDLEHLDEALRELVRKADAVVVGPGLGRSPGRRRFVSAVLEEAAAAVVDADGLVAYHGHVAALAQACNQRRAVLTPHPGEFRPLFPEEGQHLDVDPWSAAERAAEHVGTTVLLKGVPTVVAAPARTSLTVFAGNPGLATGGSGDVLSGVIGTLLAQGVDPDRAAAVGAQLLGRTADAVAPRTTARALRPMDILSALPHTWSFLARQASAIGRPPVLLEVPVPWLR